MLCMLVLAEKSGSQMYRNTSCCPNQAVSSGVRSIEELYPRYSASLSR